MDEVINSFNKEYGIKPIFGGVYTDKSVKKMCEEVDLFMDNGIHAYLEPLRFRNNSNYFSEDLNAIEEVLDYISNMTSSKTKLDVTTSKLGVNFLFKPDVSYALANKYGLSFVINDALIGEYLPKDGCGDKNNKLIKASANNFSNINLFAGITPGYLINQTTDDQWSYEMQKLNATANIILIGNRPNQNALEQIIDLKQNSQITKPLIAAQGVNVKTIAEFLMHADGVFIGSGFRYNGEISLDILNEIKALQKQIINS
ncbi:MAG: BtpA/SgcQ family protein [Candidatus Woesearchaeota archaeon]|jgi:predicted TIM-barrel enzyme